MWVVHSENIQMANLVLLFALLCVQFSRGEVVPKIEAFHEVTDEHVIPFPSKDGLGEFAGLEGDKITEEDWTEEDEKWLEEIQNLLAEDSDEDEEYELYEANFKKLIKEIEKLMIEHYPGKGNYGWLQEIAKWFDAADDDDYGDDDDDELEDESDETLADFYYWLYGTDAKNAKNNHPPLQKRFSSV